jgi:hypothetical protein
MLKRESKKHPVSKVMGDSLRWSKKEFATVWIVKWANKRKFDPKTGTGLWWKNETAEDIALLVTQTYYNVHKGQHYMTGSERYSAPSIVSVKFVEQVLRENDFVKVKVELPALIYDDHNGNYTGGNSRLALTPSDDPKQMEWRTVWRKRSEIPEGAVIVI